MSAQLTVRAKFSRIALGALLSLGALTFLQRAHALSVGQAAPEIKLTDLLGKAVSLSTLKGRVVLVDFWASWCKPCREELPVLETLHKKYASKGLVILGVNVDKDERIAKKFLSDNKLTLSFPLANDAKHEVAERYAPPTMPSSYVIDRAGKVQFVHAGFRASDAKKLEAEIAKLLD
jgi:thiol-disulfide isomerase/thioredoxin